MHGGIPEPDWNSAGLSVVCVWFPLHCSLAQKLAHAANANLNWQLVQQVNNIQLVPTTL